MEEFGGWDEAHDLRQVVYAIVTALDECKMSTASPVRASGLLHHTAIELLLAKGDSAKQAAARFLGWAIHQERLRSPI